MPTANYQEYLGKCVMINVPWIFNTFWYFVKGFLDEEYVLATHPLLLLTHTELFTILRCLLWTGR